MFSHGELMNHVLIGSPFLLSWEETSYYGEPCDFIWGAGKTSSLNGGAGEQVLFSGELGSHIIYWFFHRKLGTQVLS